MFLFVRVFSVFLLVFSYSFSTNADQTFFSLNYGWASHDMGTVLTADGQAESTLSKDDEGEGYIASAGFLFGSGSNFGFEVMYYDLGSTSFKVDAKDVIKDSRNSYIVATSGTISNDITGYGIGTVLSVDSEVSSYASLTGYVKLGAHAWDKSGSTTLLDNDNAFSGDFYNDGIGAYGALGVSVNFTENLGLNAAYHVLGITNDVSLGSSSSVTSAGLRLKF